LAACPFRSFQTVVCDACPPVIRSIRAASSAFKMWAEDFGAAIGNLEFEVVDSFGNSFGFAGFNGRAMTDNVENVMLSLQANTPVDEFYISRHLGHLHS